MRKIFIISLLITGLQAASPAQELRNDILKPGRTIAPEKEQAYPDSAEFVKLFKELYPKIKPALTVRETAKQYFESISRSFKMQGIDSAEAAKAAFKNMGDDAFYKIYFDLYRKNLSAKELKVYMDFIKTPEGEHIVEVLPVLQRALPDANMYVAKTIGLNLTPIRQAAMAKQMKEQPPKKPMPQLVRPAKPQDVFDERNAAGKDSIMQVQRLQNKIPPLQLPADSSRKR